MWTVKTFDWHGRQHREWDKAATGFPAMIQEHALHLADAGKSVRVYDDTGSLIFTNETGRERR